jgi:signal transduction histidine kinase
VSRLHRRIYVHFLGVLLVVGVATAVVVALTAREAFFREVAERMARLVATLVGERLDDHALLTHRLHQLQRDLEIDLTVRDLDGRLLASAGPLLPALGAAEVAQVRTGAVVTRARPRWYAAVVVRDPATGAPRAVLATSAPHRMGWRRLVTPVAVVAVVLLVVGVATLPLAHRISRPLERLTEAARRLGAGDLASRVPLPAVHRRWRRRREDEIAELTRAFNEMAERVERIVRGQKELLANVSHELRSPLARIRMALELLPRDPDSTARLAALEHDLDELDRLIEDVLTTARLEATGLPVELGPIDVPAMLAELAQRAHHHPVVTGKEVRVEAPPLALVADGVLLRRALWNLIENAAKYGRPPIALTAWREGAVVALAVSDEGDGIPPADRERVFVPFFRGDRARTPGGSHAAGAGAPRGVGLGLTLAHRVAEVHGGTIAVEPSRVVDGRERGCRVVLRLPADRA